MITIENAFANAAVNQKEDNAPVNSAAAAVAAATPTSEPTFTITESQLKELMAAVAAQAVGSQAATPVPANVPMVTSPRQATKPEVCAAHRILTLLDRALSNVIVGTRDHVIVPGNIYLVDQATPEILALLAAGYLIAASGAGRVSSYFARRAADAAARSFALTRR
jgi:hypothetical protein